MNTQTDQQLLQDYAGSHSEAAFAELVRRHVDLIHSAARRMVCDSHQAEDVTQGVFVALAQSARQLTHHPVLSGWLHRTTQNLAANAVRTNVRRQTREQEAVVMNELLADESDANWEHIAPHLDAALGELSEPDRDALLLRYFERKSARDIAQTLGISDEAAQKRVSRAVERLREFFAQRGVTVGAGGLVVVISANAVQAAPVGLAVTISTAAALAGTSVAATATATTIKTIAMTTLQKTLVTATVAVLAGAGIYEARQASQLRDTNQSLQRQIAELTPLAQQVQQLQQEHADATNRVAALVDELAATKRNPVEVLKLRNQVGTLRRENAALGSRSALNKLTANLETRKLLREQQKLGMGAIYEDLAKQMKLSPEQKESFQELLADQVMDSVDLITQTLHDNTPREEMERMFAALDSAGREKLLALIGAESQAQFMDYTKNLGSTLTAAQFKGSLTGEPTMKEEKKSQLLQAMKQETQLALSAAGLPADYQTVPMLNFRNIASQEQADQSLKLLGDIYDRVAVRASSFLTEEELKKFREFKAKALENSKAALLMNRQMMAPLSQ